jgi:AcrR family transcriptional regulator
MDTHDKILEAARALVEEHGRQSLSFRKVAERAGVSVGSVQYYFSAMEQLLDALTDPWHEGIQRIFQEAMADLPSAEDRQARLVEMCIEIHRLAVTHRELLLARRLDTLERGELMERRREPAKRWIEKGAQLAAGLVGGDPGRWLLTMTAIEHLLVGFALSTRAEALGQSAEQVEDFLRDAILGMGRAALGLPENAD